MAKITEALNYQKRLLKLKKDGRGLHLISAYPQSW